MLSSSWDVFLSHNSADKPLVRQLGQALKSRGLAVWLDEWELVPGRPWQEALEHIIQTAKSAAVLVGSNGLGPWEQPEMRACLNEFIKRELPVIPVLLPGAPQQPELPPFLQAMTWVDLRSGITEDGLARLEWGIAGRKPETFGNTQGAAPTPKSEPEDPLATSDNPSVSISIENSTVGTVTGIKTVGSETNFFGPLKQGRAQGNDGTQSDG